MCSAQRTPHRLFVSAYEDLPAHLNQWTPDEPGLIEHELNQPVVVKILSRDAELLE